jgi:hypothetical protein
MRSMRALDASFRAELATGHGLRAAVQRAIAAERAEVGDAAPVVPQRAPTPFGVGGMRGSSNAGAAIARSPSIPSPAVSRSSVPRCSVVPVAENIVASVARGAKAQPASPAIATHSAAPHFAGFNMMCARMLSIQPP